MKKLLRKGRLEYAKRRKSFRERGYTSEWDKARLHHLAKEPICRECAKEGRTTAANVVDHIIPHRGDHALMWDSQNNWQSLCGPCHQRKTASGL